jgi:hypothetical protein
MTRRRTKEQREAEALAALQQRLTDIYSGAQGQFWTVDDFATAEVLALVRPAIRSTFGEPPIDAWMWGDCCLTHFDNPAKAAQFLFAHGYRADSRFEEPKP